MSAHFVSDLWDRGQLARERVAREECGYVKAPLHHIGMTGRDAIQGFREFRRRSANLNRAQDWPEDPLLARGMY